MWPFNKKEPEAEVVDMYPSEKHAIRLFADGDEALRDQAIKIYRYYIPTMGAHGNGSPEQDFMSEIDTPVPDLVLRAHYRKVLLDKIKT